MNERWHEAIDLRSREAEMAHATRFAAVRREAELARERTRGGRGTRGWHADAPLRGVLRLARSAMGWSL